MYFIALNKETLSKFYYDRIWGFSYDVRALRSANNFSKVVSLLDNDALKRQSLVDQVTSIGRANPLKRFFYWFFNINNYCKNFYTLQCLYAHEIYKDAEASGTGVPETGAYRVFEDRVTFVEDKASENILREYFSHFTQKVIAFLNQRLNISLSYMGKKLTLSPGSSSSTTIALRLQEGNSSPVNDNIAENDKQTKFKVTLDFVSYLKELGIECVVGDKVTLVQFRQAYRKKCLQLHPDKPNGNEEQFKQFISNYEKFLSLIKEQQHVSIASAGISVSDEWLRAFCPELFNMFAELDDMLKKVTEENERVQQTAQIYFQGRERVNKEAEKCFRSMDEANELMRANIDALAKQNILVGECNVLIEGTTRDLRTIGDRLEFLLQRALRRQNEGEIEEAGTSQDNERDFGNRPSNT